MSDATAVYKVSGAGHHFIVQTLPASGVVSDEAIRSWCRRRVSLGGDGLILLTRTERGARIEHREVDASRSTLCLNGSRSAAQLVFHLGWQRTEFELQTDAGTLQARSIDNTRVAVELPPITTQPVRRVLAVGDMSYAGWYVEVGVPHFVLPSSTGLAEVDVVGLGPSLRSHPDLYPHGANIDFVRFLAPRRIEVRSFERGVEGETLACGTGVVAAAVAGAAAGEIELPATAMTSGGFELSVEGEISESQVERLELSGDARVVARGELLAGAGVKMARPQWSA
jgi:diaminopimelate epimerase